MTSLIFVLLFTKNISVAVAQVVVWTAKPAWNAPNIGLLLSSPDFADLDNDGDYDLLIGEHSGVTFAYENTGSIASPVWTYKPAWNAPDMGWVAAPAFADLDNDGDYDLLIGEANSGTSYAYENTGSPFLICNSTDCSSAITNAPCKCGTLTTVAADNGKYCCAGNNNVYTNQASCQAGACAAPVCPTGGLVPCGRSCNDPNTLDIDESKPCQLCHLFVLLDRIIDFLLKYILFPIAVLMLVIAGILYVGAVFEILPGGFKTISQAKGIIFSVVLGLIVIFAAFILIGLFFRQINMADWTTNIYQNWWSQGFFQIKCQIK